MERLAVIFIFINGSLLMAPQLHHATKEGKNTATVGFFKYYKFIFQSKQFKFLYNTFVQ